MKMDPIFTHELKSEKSRKVKNLVLYSFVPMLFGLAWLLVSTISIFNNRKELKALSVKVDSLKILRDSFQLEYLQAKGFNVNKGYELLDQSIRADKLIRTLMENGQIDSSITILYFRKSLDQEKVFLSLKELGYGKIFDFLSTKKALVDKETNAVYEGSKVSLRDTKIIIATLIRAGFRIQHIGRLQDTPSRERTVEVITEAPADGSPDLAVPITVDQLAKAANFNELQR